MFLFLYTFIFLYHGLISTPFRGPKFCKVIKYFVKCVLVVTEIIDRYCDCCNSGMFNVKKLFLSLKTVLLCSVMGELWQMATDVMICTDIW